MREVLAHLTAAASLNPLRWSAGVIRCRFDFDKQVAVAQYYQSSDTVVLAKGRIGGLRLAATDGPFTTGCLTVLPGAVGWKPPPAAGGTGTLPDAAARAAALPSSQHPGTRCDTTATRAVTMAMPVLIWRPR